VDTENGVMLRTELEATLRISVFTMHPIIKCFPRRLAITILCCAAFAPRGQATPITGTVGFDGRVHVSQSGNSTTLDFGPVGMAGGNARVVNGLGDYLSTLGSAASFADFSFLGSGAGATIEGGMVSPLWSFSSGGLTYSFSLTGLTNATLIDVVGARVLNVSGSGIASISGGGSSFDPTEGTFVLAGSGSSAAFHFYALTSVPDSGTTIALLGAALIGLAGVGCRVATR
jgi:hypothetical protein